ncbi:MAG: sensor domain-containing diguanylate cyclase [Deferrisomatales bacterium]|nr:sensor domain-containing diguanylate cyclase [Deferrisomatales bacterium]
MTQHASEAKHSGDWGRVLPDALWEGFRERFEGLSGLALALLDPRGELVPAGEGARPPCADLAGIDRVRCLAFYRKLAAHFGPSREPLLFRCPAGSLVIGAPVGRHASEDPPSLLLVGRGVSGDSEAPERTPAELLSLARLAQWTLQAAVEGFRQREDYQRRHAQVTGLFDLAGDLGHALSPHEVLALGLNALGVLFEVEDAALYLCDPGGETYRLHSSMGGTERALGAWTPAPAGRLRERLGEPGGAVRIEDPQELGRLGVPEPVDSLCLIPLATGETLLGLVALLNAELAPEEEQLIRGFAGQLSVALENRRLREELGAKGVEFQTLQETSTRFLTCLAPEDVFDAILDEARRITGAHKGSLMLAVNGTGELRIRSVSGLHDRIVEKLRVTSGRGIAGQVFATGKPVVVGNLEKDGRFHRRNRARYATKSFLSLPIVLEGRTAGVLNLADKKGGEPFSERDLHLLQAMAAQATIAMERSTYYAQSVELRKISITDPLTGLLNRRYFQERLTEEAERAIRHGHSLSLVLLDIDYFKVYNDANGHPAGDRALVLAGRALRASIRAIDVVSRFGGEEFAVILPETPVDGALEIAERIRKEIEGLYFPGEEALPLGRLTISLGVAGLPEDAQDLKSLVQRADRALYLAKAQGRNRVVAYATPGDIDLERPVASWTRVL